MTTGEIVNLYVFKESLSCSVLPFLIRDVLIDPSSVNVCVLSSEFHACPFLTTPSVTLERVSALYLPICTGMCILFILIKSFFLETPKVLIYACFYSSYWFISLIIKGVHILCMMLWGNLVNHPVIQNIKLVVFELQPSFGAIITV